MERLYKESEGKQLGWLEKLGKEGEKEKIKSESERGGRTIKEEEGVGSKLIEIIEIGLSRSCLKPLSVGLLGNPLTNKLGTQVACPGKPHS